jgi:hypothetical protein
MAITECPSDLAHSFQDWMGSIPTAYRSELGVVVQVRDEKD